MNIFCKLTSPPAFKTASGVAEVTPSYTNVVIGLVKERRRKHLAARAGFIKFCPKPPNNCLTTIIANTEPKTPIHTGNVGGRLSASKSPVSAAEKSPIVDFLCIINFWYKYSDSTAPKIQAKISIAALLPN